MHNPTASDYTYRFQFYFNGKTFAILHCPSTTIENRSYRSAVLNKHRLFGSPTTVGNQIVSLSCDETLVGRRRASTCARRGRTRRKERRRPPEEGRDAARDKGKYYGRTTEWRTSVRARVLTDDGSARHKVLWRRQSGDAAVAAAVTGAVAACDARDDYRVSRRNAAGHRRRGASSVPAEGWARRRAYTT